jgi:sugar transferase (PEP-CTERM/EpsH1 system associated)
MTPAPLIVHVVYRFAVGGLENGVVNLVNRLPADRWRHAIVALTEIDPNFCRRIVRDDVRCVALEKAPGHALALYPRLFRLLRQWRPTIVHTRNLAALETMVPAWAAGVPVRIHGEHGRDMGDLDGSNRRGQWLRRAYRPFVTRYVALSPDLERYLTGRIGVRAERIEQIFNGVDTLRFRAASGGRPPIEGCPFRDSQQWLVGTVGRLEQVKNQTMLVEAFVQLLRRNADARRHMRLVVVGDGSLRPKLESLLVAGGVREFAWLPGEQADIPAILRGLDLFVLPSLAEGVSNTILEAMACGVPVVATRAGANDDLVEDGTTGLLVPVADRHALEEAILGYFAEPAVGRRHGRAGRQRVEQRFSLERMVERYEGLYAGLTRARCEGVPFSQTVPGR